MAYELNEAKQIVIEAGKKLIESGLIARTWGNVSARISDTQFAITPSGLPYETLTPDQIVVVNIEDNTYEGDIKPSSEKKMHSAIYKLRPDVNFMIHTHQMAASAISTTGKLVDVPADYVSVLGSKVPTADYGLSSTQTLTDNVAKVVEDYPDCKAFLMMSHGTLCLGKDFDEAFDVAAALEETSKKIIADACGATDFDKLPAKFLSSFVDVDARDIQPVDMGSSVLNPENGTFTLTMADGTSRVVALKDEVGASPAARLHIAIYKNSDATYIRSQATPDVVALSKEGKTETPYLDDFAQIAGFNVKNIAWDPADPDSAKAAGKAIKSRNAVLVKGHGALCTGTSDSDAHAVQLVLEKECVAHMYAAFAKKAKVVAPVGRFLERTIYVMKYSKMAEKK